MPALLIDTPNILPPSNPAQSQATESADPASEGQSFKNALDRELRNQAPDNNSKTQSGKSDKAEDGKARDPGTSDASADPSITQPDLALLQIPMPNPVSAQPPVSGNDGTRELISSAALKQGMAINLRSPTRQNAASDEMAMSPGNILRQDLDARDGGKTVPDQVNAAAGRDTKLAQPAALIMDQKALADHGRLINRTKLEDRTLRQDATNTPLTMGEQSGTAEAGKSDSLSILTANIRPATNQPLASIEPPTGSSMPMTRIDAQIGTPAWNHALGQQVVMMATVTQQQAEIHLNPQEMGPIKVTVTLDNSQANLSFVVHHLATREAIESALPKLTEMMAQSGITLGQANVQADTSGSFTQSGQSARSGERGANPPVNDIGMPQTQASVKAISQRGLVDTFA